MHRRRELRIALVATVLAAHGAAAITMFVRLQNLRVSSLLPALAITVAAAVIADLIHSRRRVAGELAQQRAATAAQSAARLRGEERARIARELHDVVAHHLSVVVVRADSASRRVAGLDEAAVAEFRAIAADARESLEQMRGVLRLLRADAVDAPAAQTGLAPQPVLAAAGELVDEARAAGASIEVSGEWPAVEGVVGLAAYRVVQEAVTNAVRHAPGLPVRIDVRRGADRLSLCVENRVRDPAVRTLVDGHGLRGMRERVCGAGGEVDAGYTDGGTFVVRVELPLDDTRGQQQASIR